MHSALEKLRIIYKNFLFFLMQKILLYLKENRSFTRDKTIPNINIKNHTGTKNPASIEKWDTHLLCIPFKKFLYNFLCTVYSFQKSNRLIAAHSASIEDSMISSSIPIPQTILPFWVMATYDIAFEEDPLDKECSL